MSGTYSIDTSSLIDGWFRVYPREVFPCVWEKVEELIAQGRLWAPAGVLKELTPPPRTNSSLYDWAKDHDELFVEEDDEVQAAGKSVLAMYPELIPQHSARSLEDPFVIGLARIRGATVVTAEKSARFKGEVHIPDVCQGLGIRSIDLVTVMKDENWRFE